MKTIRRSLQIHSQTLRQLVPSTSLVMLFVACGCLSGCATEPFAAAPIRTVPTVASTVQVYVYPTKNQSSTQLDRDRYECHRWAFEQTHFDPSSSAGGPSPAVVRTTTTGVNTATGAIAGAVLGAAIGTPHDAAVGAVAGAIAGSAIGAAVDGNEQRVVQQQSGQRYQGELERAQSYRRALTACLEGRGYTVK